MSSTRFFKPVFLTAASLIGLLLGIGLGLVGTEDENGLLGALTLFLGPLVSLWLRALTIAAILMASTYIVVAITHMRRKKDAGRLVGIAVITHQALMMIAGALSFAATALFVFFPRVDIDLILSSVELPRPPAADGQPGVVESMRGLFVDPLTAIITGNVMAIIIWSVVVGWLLSMLKPRFRDPIFSVFEFGSQIAQKGVLLLLVFMPVALFHVALVITPGAGSKLIGSLGAYLVVLSGIQIVMTAVLYLIAWIIGRVPPRAFTIAAAPAQVLAIGSRSSLACLPAVVEGARALKLPATVSDIVVPLSSGTMRLSQLASHPFQASFIAYMYGIDLELSVLIIFTLGLFVVSYGAPGVPSAGSLASLSLYLALGIPIEGYLLQKAIDIIPDCFKTVLNVTEDLAIATVVARFHKDAEEGETVSQVLQPVAVPAKPIP